MHVHVQSLPVATHIDKNVPEYFFMNAPWYTVVILLMVIVVIAWSCNVGNLKYSGYHEATLKAAY